MDCMMGMRRSSPLVDVRWNCWDIFVSVFCSDLYGMGFIFFFHARNSNTTERRGP